MTEGRDSLIIQRVKVEFEDLKNHFEIAMERLYGDRSLDYPIASDIILWDLYHEEAEDDVVFIQANSNSIIVTEPFSVHTSEKAHREQFYHFTNQIEAWLEDALTLGDFIHYFDWYGDDLLSRLNLTMEPILHGEVEFLIDRGFEGEFLEANDRFFSEFLRIFLLRIDDLIADYLSIDFKEYWFLLFETKPYEDIQSYLRGMQNFSPVDWKVRSGFYETAIALSKAVKSEFVYEDFEMTFFRQTPESVLRCSAFESLQIILQQLKNIDCKITVRVKRDHFIRCLSNMECDFKNLNLLEEIFHFYDSEWRKMNDKFYRGFCENPTAKSIKAPDIVILIRVLYEAGLILGSPRSQANFEIEKEDLESYLAFHFFGLTGFGISNIKGLLERVKFETRSKNKLKEKYESEIQKLNLSGL